MFDVTALGQALIDFTPAGHSPKGNKYFERNPGGAAVNVLACISKLGGKTAFIGKAGNDMLGNYLREILKEYNIDIKGMRFCDAVCTPLAFVQVDDKGDRTFSYYSNRGDDTALNTNEVDFTIIKESRVFHIGSILLTKQPSKNATFAALEYAKNCGCVISYDPNLRLSLWKSKAHARKELKSVLTYANILKISEEELAFITGYEDLNKGMYNLYNKYKTSIILVTMGNMGCYYSLHGIVGIMPAFLSAKTKDKIGAGDAFLGGFLYSMLSSRIKNIKDVDIYSLEQMIEFANATASLCTINKGSIPSMPDLNSVKKLIK